MGYLYGGPHSFLTCLYCDCMLPADIVLTVINMALMLQRLRIFLFYYCRSWCIIKRQDAQDSNIPMNYDARSLPSLYDALFIFEKLYVMALLFKDTENQSLCDSVSLNYNLCL